MVMMFWSQRVHKANEHFPMYFSKTSLWQLCITHLGMVRSYSDSDALHFEISLHGLSPYKVAVWVYWWILLEQKCLTVFVPSLDKSGVPHRCYNCHCGKCLPGPAQSDLAPWQGGLALPGLWWASSTILTEIEITNKEVLLRRMRLLWPWTTIWSRVSDF